MAVSTPAEGIEIMSLKFGFFILGFGIALSASASELKKSLATCDKAIAAFLEFRSRGTRDIERVVRNGKDACQDLVERIEAAQVLIPEECRRFTLAKFESSSATTLRETPSLNADQSVLNAMADARGLFLTQMKKNCGLIGGPVQGVSQETQDCEWGIEKYRNRLHQMPSELKPFAVRSSLKMLCERKYLALKNEDYVIPDSCTRIEMGEFRSPQRQGIYEDAQTDNKFLQVKATDTVSKAVDKMKNTYFTQLHRFCESK